MGLFDRISESHFSRTRDRRTVYHPFGAFGGGRIVDCGERLERIRRFHRRQLKFGVPTGFIIGALLVIREFDPFSVTLASVTLLLTGLRGYFLVRGLPRTQERLGVHRVLRRNPKITRFVAWLLIIAGALQVLASLSLPLSAPGKLADLVIPAVFFGATGIAATAIGFWLRGILGCNEYPE